MRIAVNPGSGPVENATEDQARANLRAFLTDCDITGASYALGVNQGDGRFRYKVSNGIKVVDLDMPGIPLEQVRWMDEDSGDIWDFPRLYIDGSSWIWCFAINIFLSAGEPEEEDD